VAGRCACLRAADAALRTLTEEDAGLTAYQIAEVYALRNDAKATFEWLDRASSNRDPGIEYLLYDSFILRYTNDSRVAASPAPVRGLRAAVRNAINWSRISKDGNGH
jgi:hypothetical protein